MKKVILSLFVLLASVSVHAQTKTEFINESQHDFENRMQWFTDASYGMFIHFGLATLRLIESRAQNG